MPDQPRPRPGPAAGWIRDNGAIVACMAALGGLVFWSMHQALVDDAYITLDYARNLVETGQWGLLPHHPANTATSPLNVLLIALFTLVLGGVLKGLGVLYVLLCVALTVSLLGLGRQMGLGRRFAVIAAPLLVADPLLASTIGLETMLAVTALVALLTLSGRDRAWPVGIAVAVAVLTRLDMVVPVVVVLVLRRRLWRKMHWIALWAAVVAVPWFLYSWVNLGSATPDTLVIKTGDTWGTFWSGLVSKYLAPHPFGVVATLASCALGLLALLTWPLWRRWLLLGDRDALPVAAAAGLAYYLTFARLGVSPFFWYYGVPVATLVLCASGGIAALSYLRAALLRAVATALALAAAVVPAGVAWGKGLERQAPLRVAFVKGNWAEPQQYAKIGRDLRHTVGPHVPVKSPGEIGTLLFYCRCTLVDKFSDRDRLVPRIIASEQGSPLMRLNYRNLDVRRLEMIHPRYVLKWRPGHDPSGRGWNVYSRTGHRQDAGYLALLIKHYRHHNQRTHQRGSR